MYHPTLVPCLQVRSCGEAEHLVLEGVLHSLDGGDRLLRSGCRRSGLPHRIGECEALSLLGRAQLGLLVLKLGLELALGRLELAVGRLELAVGRLELAVGRLELAIGRLELALHSEIECLGEDGEVPHAEVLDLEPGLGGESELAVGLVLLLLVIIEDRREGRVLGVEDIQGVVSRAKDGGHCA